MGVWTTVLIVLVVLLGRMPPLVKGLKSTWQRLRRSDP